MKEKTEPTVLGVSLPLYATKFKTLEIVNAWRACMTDLSVAAKSKRTAGSDKPSADAKS